MRVISPHTRQPLSRLRVCDVRALDCARVGTLSVPQLQSWYVHTDPVCRKQRTVETDRCMSCGYGWLRSLKGQIWRKIGQARTRTFSELETRDPHSPSSILDPGSSCLHTHQGPFSDPCSAFVIISLRSVCRYITTLDLGAQLFDPP